MNGCHSEDVSGEDKDVLPHHTPKDASTHFRILEEYAYVSLPHLESEVLNLKLRLEGALGDNGSKECSPE